MPELPEVETVRLGLNNLVAVCPQFTGGEVLLASTIATGDGDYFLDSLRGQLLGSWRRRGKYLLGSLSGGGWLGVHLRMTGRLLWCDRSLPVGRHTRVRLFLGHDRELRFDDQRTFGKMWFVPPQVAIQGVIKGLAEMGAEPLSEEFTADYLAEKLGARNRAIKTILLDQRVVAGIGNIYADEALFVSRIHPEMVSNRLDRGQVTALHRGIIEVLRAGLAFGGTTFSDFQDVNGGVGNYLEQAWVFRRTGHPCRVCGTGVARVRVGGRASHFCPRCQSPQICHRH